MLQVNFLRDNKERVLEGLKKRQFKNLELVDEAIATDEERKKFSLNWIPNFPKSIKSPKKSDF